MHRTGQSMGIEGAFEGKTRMNVPGTRAHDGAAGRNPDRPRGRVVAPLAVATFAIASACSRSDDRTGPASAPATAATHEMLSVAERIGWFHGHCLALANARVVQGTSVWLVLTNEPQSVVAAQLGPSTSSPETCKPLLEDRAEENAKPGVVFYSLNQPSLQPTDMGIGIVDSPAKPEIVNGRARIDLDRNGRTEVFSSCATSEGLRFAVWDETPYQGEPRWTGYYYLGYESPANCPK